MPGACGIWCATNEASGGSGDETEAAGLPRKKVEKEPKILREARAELEQERARGLVHADAAARRESHGKASSGPSDPEPSAERGGLAAPGAQSGDRQAGRATMERQQGHEKVKASTATKKKKKKRKG